MECVKNMRCLAGHCEAF